MVKQLVSTVLSIPFLFFSFSAFSSDDPCIQALGVSSPGQAASLSARREGYTKPKANERADWAEKGKDGKKDNEAQTMSDWVGDALSIAAEWYTTSAPQFLAGAMKELNPMIKSKLMVCYSRRSGQGRADKEASDKNYARGKKARAADEGVAGGYDPKVIRPDSSEPSDVEPPQEMLAQGIPAEELAPLRYVGQ